MTFTGQWNVPAIDGAEVRLSSGSHTAMNIEMRAPIRSGRLDVATQSLTLDLVIAMDKVKTGNFLTEAAIRSLLAGYRATDLVYQGSGSHSGATGQVSGQASAGSLDLTIELAVSFLAQASEIELVGSTSFGRVTIPIPGIGTIDDLQVNVDARLAVQRA